MSMRAFFVTNSGMNFALTRFCTALLWLVLLTPLQAMAAVDIKSFSSDAERERFHTLVNELRCPKCQNQNLADSNSPIAADLRDEIYRMLEEGKSDQEIVDFLVARYGEFVLYKPPVKGTTLLLWLMPVALLLIGLFVIVMVRRRQQPAADAQSTLASDEQARLQALLSESQTGAGNSDDTKGDAH